LSERAEVPDDVAAKVRAVCLALPEVREETAWVGTRWRVRTKTFAHVLRVNEGRPPAYARAAGTDGAAVLLMFRSTGEELAALRDGGPPFFAPPWRADEVGLVLGDDPDWDEVRELLTESYCAVAPAKLVALVDRPAE
jgi:predicted DNA-binding protein (MmcQ/YjbR family)